jgi:hypothetical protein
MDLPWKKNVDANGDGFSEISAMDNLTIGTRITHRLGKRGNCQVTSLL